MLEDYSVRLHTPQELERAKTKGQVVGWLQGAVVTFGGLLLLNLLGWIPTLLVLAVVGFLGYKLLAGKKDAK